MSRIKGRGEAWAAWRRAWLLRWPPRCASPGCLRRGVMRSPVPRRWMDDYLCGEHAPTKQGE